MDAKRLVPLVRNALGLNVPKVNPEQSCLMFGPGSSKGDLVWPAVSNVPMSPGGGPSRALSGQGVPPLGGGHLAPTVPAPPCRDVAAGSP